MRSPWCPTITGKRRGAGWACVVHLRHKAEEVGGKWGVRSGAGGEKEGLQGNVQLIPGKMTLPKQAAPSRKDKKLAKLWAAACHVGAVSLTSHVPVFWPSPPTNEHAQAFVFLILEYHQLLLAHSLRRLDHLRDRRADARCRDASEKEREKVIGKEGARRHKKKK